MIPVWHTTQTPPTPISQSVPTVKMSIWWRRFRRPILAYWGLAQVVDGELVYRDISSYARFSLGLAVEADVYISITIGRPND